MTTTLNVMPKDTQHPPRREAERRDRDANPKAVKIETRDLSFFYGGLERRLVGVEGAGIIRQIV